MSGELYLDGPSATFAGRGLSAAGKEMVAINNGPVAGIAAASQEQPWGRDDIGAAFQKNYAPLLQQFTEAFGNIAGYVDGLGEAAVASVQDNLAADSRASENVNRAYRA